jgi:hypothetical protein
MNNSSFAILYDLFVDIFKLEKKEKEISNLFVIIDILIDMQVLEIRVLDYFQ